jgi:hypothetical protein
MAESVEAKKLGNKQWLKYFLGALALACIFALGLIVKNNLLDNAGSVPKQVSAATMQINAKQWLRTSLKDPESVQYIQWSTVSKTENGLYSMRLEYRAKNSFNAYVVENVTFSFDTLGYVVSAKREQ